MKTLRAAFLVGRVPAGQFVFSGKVCLLVSVMTVATPSRGLADIIASIECRFESPRIEDVRKVIRVEIEGCGQRVRAGEPTMPYRTVRLLMPNGAAPVSAVSEALEPAEQLRLHARIAHGRPPVPLRLRLAPHADTEADEAVYGSADPYPDKLVELVSTQLFHGRRIAIVRVYPAQYLPKRNLLLFYPALRVELHGTVERATRRARTISRAALVEILSMPDNANGSPAGVNHRFDTSATNSATDYLLISSEELEPHFEPLLQRKRDLGLTTETSTMGYITNTFSGTDDAEKVRNCIREGYSNRSVRFVLLGGDVDVVPCRHAYASAGGEQDIVPCDLYFACLDGSWNDDGDDVWGEPNDGEGGGDVDLLAEVLVGRAPVETPAEADAFVAKTLRYETNSPPCPASVAMVGEYLGYFSPGGHVQGGDGLDPLLPHVRETLLRPEWLDDRPATSPAWDWMDSLALLNGSPNTIMHNGHTDDNLLLRLYPSDLSMLANGHPFFLFSVGCNAGAFDYPWDSIGEELVVKAGAGSYAAVLNARLGWFDPEAPWRYSGEFQEAFLKEILIDNRRAIGHALREAKHALVGSVETIGDMAYRWCYFELTLFGDPHVPVVVPPRFLSVDAWDDGKCRMRWTSYTNYQYSIHGSTNPTAGFDPIDVDLTATPPINTYTTRVQETRTTFYRVEQHPQ